MSAEKIKHGLSFCRSSAGSDPGHLTKREEIIQATTALLLHSILQELREIKEMMNNDPARIEGTEGAGPRQSPG